MCFFSLFAHSFAPEIKPPGLKLNKIVPKEFIKVNQLGRKRKASVGHFLAGVVHLLLGTDAILLLYWVSTF